MNPKFTKIERLVSGTYCALIATLGLSIMLQETDLLLSVFGGGFLSGYFVTPAILQPNNFLVLRSIAAGCLSTLAASFFTVIFIFIMFAFKIDATNFSLEIRHLENTGEALENFIAIALFGVLFALPYSIIGAIATVVFSYKLSKHRNRHPELAPDIFD
ncbi:hypothetical protein [Kiloniella antarctica]|uniref:DUF2062 domain-containing protein n=1 Tax=Kiloniella antarctica TaxID=1550907 RepID=A0ABW5BK11_9PROT